MPNGSYTDQQLRLLVQAPGFTDADWGLLTPEEQDRALALRAPLGDRVRGAMGDDPGATGLTQRMMETLGGVATGVAKGAGNTVTGLGNLARKIPGVNRLDDVMEPYRFDITPRSTPEKVGFYGEQAAEYLVPAGAARKAAVKGLVRAIPDAASPSTMATLNKLAAYTGRAIGEGASAAGVSALHGNSDPMETGVEAAAIPAVTGALSAGAGSLPWLAPILAALGTAHAIPGNLGMMGGLSVANQARGAARRAFTPPVVKTVQRAVSRNAPRLLRAAVGNRSDITQPNRRRVVEDEE